MGLNGKAVYMEASTPGRRRAFALPQLLALLMALFLVFSLSMGGYGTARAEDNPEQRFNEAAEKFGVKPGKDAVSQLLEKYDAWKNPGQGGEKSEKEKEEDRRTTFVGVIERLLSPGYINYTPKAVAPSIFGEPAKTWNCNAQDPLAGTALYHNCDVPNMMAEIIQSFIGYLRPMGMTNATLEDAQVSFGFGLPSRLPGDGEVPVDPKKRSVKYTGLELVGYNLKFTRYNGEWDHIAVETKARAMMNYGFLEKIQVAGSSAINGVLAGVGGGIGGAVDGIKQGDILGAAAAGRDALFNKGASAAINTILDTSDYSVFANNAWYRLEYPGTFYGGPVELNAQARSLMMTKQLKVAIEGSAPEEAVLPDEFKNLEKGPAKPKESVSKCIVNGKEYKPGTPAPGVPESECKEAAAKTEKGDSTWSKDGGTKGETLKEWRAAQEATFAAAEKYGLNCEMDFNSEADRADRLTNFYLCWDQKWKELSPGLLQGAQKEENQGWFDFFKKGILLAKAMWDQRDDNYNAPWNRFVCADERGNYDMKGATYRFVYDKDSKKPTGNCPEPRPPVQNGWFGNGYLGGPGQPGEGEASQQVQMDTRWTISEQGSIIDLVVNSSGAQNIVGGFGLRVAIFTTQLSNLALDLAFSPLFKNLGLTDIFVSLIESLRDSLFFPLAMLVVGVSAVYLLIATFKSQSYLKGFKDIFIMSFTYVTMASLLLAPRAVITIVDEWPAEIEATVAGAIFNTGNQQKDALCSVSGGTPSGKGWNVTAQKDGYTPANSTRTILCNVWQVFTWSPYVAGQWGESYKDLYAAGKSAGQGTSARMNSNDKLVGDAAVTLGGGSVVNNWALYQADVLTSGTSTTSDNTTGSGYVPRDIYRVVDMQAGPNMGAKSDGRTLQTWSGKDGSSKVMAGLIGAIAGIVGAITIVTFALVKIELTFIAIIMVLFLPFMALMGLQHTGGRMKLRGYLGTILGLMLQRIFLVAFLAVMLRILVEIVLETNGYFMTGAMTIIITLLFHQNRKRFLEMISSGAQKVSGGASMGAANIRNTIRNSAPRSVKQWSSQAKTTAKGVATGAAGGFITNGAQGAIRGARRAAQVNSSKELRKQRREGVGALRTTTEGVRAGKRAAHERTRSSETYKETTNKLNERRQNDTDPNLRNLNKRIVLDPANKQDREALDLLDRIKSNREVTGRRLARIDKGNKKRLDKSVAQPLDDKSTMADVIHAQNITRAQRQKHVHQLEKLETLERDVLDQLYKRHSEGVSVTEVTRKELERLSADFEELLEERFGSDKSKQLLDNDPNVKYIADLGDDDIGWGHEYS